LFIPQKAETSLGERFQHRMPRSGEPNSEDEETYGA
jgi:hypothetical protein